MAYLHNEKIINVNTQTSNYPLLPKPCSGRKTSTDTSPHWRHEKPWILLKPWLREYLTNHIPIAQRQDESGIYSSYGLLKSLLTMNIASFWSGILVVTFEVVKRDPTFVVIFILFTE